MWQWIRKRNKYQAKLSDQEIQKNLSEMEKGDALAMFIAALITFLPPIIIILVIIYGSIYLLFS